MKHHLEGVTMDKIGYGKWGASIAPVALLFFLFAAIAAQPDFLSINCGAKRNYTDENNIRWVTDANYIDDLGQTANMGNDYDDYLSSLRFFPKPLNKSCYQLPVVPDVPYLLRLWFAPGNFSEFQQEPSFAFSIETKGMLFTTNVSTTPDGVFYEPILVSSGTVLHICLIRTSEFDDPFISAIELRMLEDGMYERAKPGTLLNTISRTDVGGQIYTVR